MLCCCYCLIIAKETAITTYNNCCHRLGEEERRTVFLIKANINIYFLTERERDHGVHVEVQPCNKNCTDIFHKGNIIHVYEVCLWNTSTLSLLRIYKEFLQTIVKHFRVIDYRAKPYRQRYLSHDID